MTAPRPLRTVQWATGNIGTRALQGIIDHPYLDLAGVWVHAPDKVGLDAGDLCDRATTGVAATDRVEDIVALEADCVLYMPRALDADEVCVLLENGANVVTTRGEFHHPPSMDPSLRQRVEEACQKGSTSIHSTGSSPGFITEALPLVLASIQRRLDHLSIAEFADLSQRNSPDLLFQIMGFGKAPEKIGQHRIDHGKTSFGPSLRLLADGLSIPLTDVEASGEVASTTSDVTIAAGLIEAGTVGAQRITVEGIHNGRSVVSFQATWYCTTDLDVDWDLRPTGWRIYVDGDAPLDVQLRFPISLDQMAETSPGYTANRAVNAVAALVQAAPGIRTTLDLPRLTAHLG